MRLGYVTVCRRDLHSLKLDKIMNWKVAYLMIGTGVCSFEDVSQAAEMSLWLERLKASCPPAQRFIRVISLLTCFVVRAASKATSANS